MARKFSPKQLAAQRKFAEMVRARSKAKKTGPKKIYRKIRSVNKRKGVRMKHKKSFLGGISLKGIAAYVVSLYLMNAPKHFTNMQTGKWDPYVIRDNLQGMTGNTWGRYLFLFSVYKFGDAGLLQKIGMKNVRINKTAAAIDLWALSNPVPIDVICTAANHARYSQWDSVSTKLQDGVSADPLSVIALGYSTYRFKSPVSF